MGGNVVLLISIVENISITIFITIKHTYADCMQLVLQNRTVLYVYDGDTKNASTGVINFH